MGSFRDGRDKASHLRKISRKKLENFWKKSGKAFHNLIFDVIMHKF